MVGNGKNNSKGKFLFECDYLPLCQSKGCNPGVLSLFPPALTLGPQILHLPWPYTMQDQRQVPQGKNISPFSLHLIQGTLSLREPGYSSALKQVPQHRNEKESITVSFRETSLPCSIPSCYASSALQREYSHFPGKENGFTITVVVCTK